MGDGRAAALPFMLCFAVHDSDVVFWLICMLGGILFGRSFVLTVLPFLIWLSVLDCLIVMSVIAWRYDGVGLLCCCSSVWLSAGLSAGWSGCVCYCLITCSSSNPSLMNVFIQSERFLCFIYMIDMLTLRVAMRQGGGRTIPSLTIIEIGYSLHHDASN